MTWTREILHQRHRLSHRQVDDFLGEKHQGDEMGEKLAQLDKLGCFFRISDAFANHHIHFINLKGPILSQRIYGDPTYRYYKDFDFLINPESVEKAIAILEEKGMEPLNFHWPKDRIKQKKILKYLNQINLVDMQHEVSVEIHWKLFHWEVANPELLRQKIQRNSGQLTLSGRQFQVMSPELELIYLIIHGGLHAWFRLKWLVDVQEFRSKTSLDPDKFSEWVQYFKAEKMVALADALLLEFFPHTPEMGYAAYLDPYTLIFSKERIFSEHELPYHDLASFRRHFRFKWGLFSGWTYKSSLLKFSTFHDSEVNHPYLPLHPLTALIQRGWDRLFSR